MPDAGSGNAADAGARPSATDGRRRCFGTGAKQALYARYHDEEWGVPVRDDRLLFETLILEGAQAGLSWETILKKRDGYRTLFEGLEPDRVARLRDATLEQILLDPRIVRHRQKVYSTRGNARAFLELQDRHGSVARWLWDFVDDEPVVNHWHTHDDVPTRTELSDRLSKALKAAGMSFVGTTIVYAWLQGVGVVDDHLSTCWLRAGA